MTHEPCIADRIRARLEEGMNNLGVSKEVRELAIAFYKETRGELLSGNSPRYHALKFFLMAAMRVSGTPEYGLHAGYYRNVLGWYKHEIGTAFNLSIERVQAAAQAGIWNLKNRQSKEKITE